MYTSEQAWREVDAYLVDLLVDGDDALHAAQGASEAAGMPGGEVAPNQGALLQLLALMVGARRILEVGTLGGYSTIWLARALPEGGALVSLEIDPDRAAIARRNLTRAGLDNTVKVLVGPAEESLRQLREGTEEPFDLVFIDADKPSNPAYLTAALELTRSGSVIVADNIVRDGAVIDPDSDDDRVVGVRTFLQMLHDDPRLDATAIQTVGSKGWDGFAIALVR